MYPVFANKGQKYNCLYQQKRGTYIIVPKVTFHFKYASKE